MRTAGLVLPFVLLFSCLHSARSEESSRTQVAMLGVVHRGHLKSKVYPVSRVVETVRRYKPDVVFVEIPPYLHDAIVARVDKTGFETRLENVRDLTWIPAFPELYRGVLPLRKEMGFTVVPVSGWKPEVSADRRKYREANRKDPVYQDRKRIHRAVARAFSEVRDRPDAGNDPHFLNSRRHDDLRQLERTAWAACHDAGLGRGGEVAINRAHYKNVAEALARFPKKRILIVYGAAHRYWFLRELRKRQDLTLLDIRKFIPPLPNR